MKKPKGLYESLKTTLLNKHIFDIIYVKNKTPRPIL